MAPHIAATHDIARGPASGVNDRLQNDSERRVSQCHHYAVAVVVPDEELTVNARRRRMPMPHYRVMGVRNLPAMPAQPPRQVGVFVVEKQPLIEGADAIQRCSPQSGGTTTEPEDIGHGRRRIHWRQPRPVAAVAADRHLVAGAVQQLNPVGSRHPSPAVDPDQPTAVRSVSLAVAVGQDDARSHGAELIGVRVIERREQRRDEAGLADRVVIDEDDEWCGRLDDAAVDCCAKAEVRGQRDHPNLRIGVGQKRGGAVGRSVVDHHDLDGPAGRILREQSVKARGQEVPAVPRGDYDRGRFDRNRGAGSGHGETLREPLVLYDSPVVAESVPATKDEGVRQCPNTTRSSTPRTPIPAMPKSSSWSAATSACSISAARPDIWPGHWSRKAAPFPALNTRRTPPSRRVRHLTGCWWVTSKNSTWSNSLGATNSTRLCSVMCSNICATRWRCCVGPARCLPAAGASSFRCPTSPMARPASRCSKGAGSTGNSACSIRLTSAFSPSPACAKCCAKPVWPPSKCAALLPTSSRPSWLSSPRITIPS